MNSKLGFYSCQGKVFDSKIKAMIYANPLNLDIGWHFNGDVFGKYDWTVEPTKTLDELYDERARRIREEYDYVILSYSGGADSHNMLESFLRQGLFIDEVVSNWALDASKKYLDTSGGNTNSSNNNAEFYLNTKHRLDEIRNRSPLTKLTVNDTSKTIIDGLLTKDDPSWVENRNDVLNVTGVFTYNLPYFKEIRKTFDKGKKVAFVLGVDKPRVHLVDGNAYLCFTDKTVNMIPTDEHFLEYPNATTVFYYWDPDAVDLLCKQAHTVLKRLKTSNPLKQLWATEDNKIRRLYHEPILKDMLYPTTWSRKFWQTKKSFKDWDSELDHWFTRGWRGTREHTIWLNGIAELVPKISSFLARQDGVVSGSKMLFSNFYLIGSL
jgi:hypothetical protein